LGAGYCFYLRRRPSDANDVLYRLAAKAAAVVTDDYPTFVAAQHNSSVPGKIGGAYSAVDSTCIVPMNRHEKREYAAYTMRTRIRRVLNDYLNPPPDVKLKRRWSSPPPSWHVDVSTKEIPALVASCQIDHRVSPSLTFEGGRAQAEKRLDQFLEHRL